MQTEQRSGQQQHPKKKYQAPQLKVYGSLAALTRSVVNGNGRNDTAMGNDKTG